MKNRPSIQRIYPRTQWQPIEVQTIGLQPWDYYIVNNRTERFLVASHLVPSSTAATPSFSGKMEGTVVSGVATRVCQRGKSVC